MCRQLGLPATGETAAATALLLIALYYCIHGCNIQKINNEHFINANILQFFFQFTAAIGEIYQVSRRYSPNCVLYFGKNILLLIFFSLQLHLVLNSV